MAGQVRTIRLIVNASAAERGLKKLQRSFKNVERVSLNLNSTLYRMQGLFGTFGVAFGASKFTEMVDVFTAAEGRIKQFTGSLETAIRVEEHLVEVSKRTFSGYEQTSRIFVRVSNAARGLGYTYGQVATAVEALNATFVLTGATAQEARSASLQLAQGIGSTKLQGEELRAVMESNILLATLIADEMGIATGELKKFGSEGKITADIVLRAITKNSDDLLQKLKAMTPTMSMAANVLTTEFGHMAKQFDRAVGMTEKFSKATIWLANNLQNVLGGAFVGLSMVAIPFLIKAVGALTAAMLKNPFGILAVGAAVAAGAIIEHFGGIENTLAMLSNYYIPAAQMAFESFSLKTQAVFARLGNLLKAAFGPTFKFIEDRILDVVALYDVVVDGVKKLFGELKKTAPKQGADWGFDQIGIGENVRDLEKQAAAVDAARKAFVGYWEANKNVGKGVEDSGDAVERFLEKFIEGNKKLTKSVEESAEGAKGQKDALDVLIDSLDPAGKAAYEMFENTMLLDEALEAGKINAEEYAKYIGILHQNAEVTNPQMEAMRDRFAEIAERIDPATVKANKFNEEMEFLKKAFIELEIPAKRQKELLEKLRKEYEGTGKKAKKMAEEVPQAFKDIASSIRNSFRDMFRDMLDGGKASFSNFADSLVSTFKDMVAEMATQAIMKPVIVPMMSVVGGAMGVSSSAQASIANEMGVGGNAGTSLLGSLLPAGGVTAAVGSALGGLGGSIGAFGYGMMGGAQVGLGGFGTAVSGLAGGGGAASFGAVIGTAMPIIAPLAIAAILASGMFEDNDETAWTRGQSQLGNGAIGLGRQASVDYMLTNQDDETGGFGIERARYRTSAGMFEFGAHNGPFASAQDAEAFGNAVMALGGIEQGVINAFVTDLDKFNDELGDITTTFDMRDPNWQDALKSDLTNRFSTILNTIDSDLGGAFDAMDVDLKNMGDVVSVLSAAFAASKDQIGIFSTEFTGGMALTFQEGVALVQQFNVEGETLTETFQTMSAKAVLVVDAFKTLGWELPVVGDTAMELATSAMSVADTIITAAGGLEQFSTGLTSFLTGFYTDSEQLARMSETLSGSFAELGKTLPESREGFRAMVEGIDVSTEAGQRLAGALIALSPAMDQFFDKQDQVDAALQSTADKAAKAAQEIADAAEAAAEEQRRALEAAAEEQRRALETLAEEQRRALEAAAEEQRRALETLQSNFEYLRATLDPVGEITRRYESDLSLLRESFTKLNVSTEEQTYLLSALDDAYQTDLLEAHTAAIQDQVDWIMNLGETRVDALQDEIDATQQLREAAKATAESIANSVASLREDIFLHGMTDKEQFSFYKNDADRIRSSIGSLTSTDQIQEAMDNLLARTTSSWNLLDDAGKSRRQDDYLAFIDDANEAAQNRIKEIEEGLADRENQLYAEMNQVLSEMNDFLQGAGMTQQQAADTMKEAGYSMQQAASTPKEIIVKVKQIQTEIG